MSILRRKFLGSALTASAAAGVLLHAGEEPAVAETPNLLAIENDDLAIAIDRRTGCLDRLESKDGSWKLKGGGMRLHVPVPDHRYHYLTDQPGGGGRKMLKGLGTSASSCRRFPAPKSDTPRR